MRLRTVEWSRLLSPGVVAVVGATDREGSQQRAQFAQIRERLTGRGAVVVPVHPTKPEILGTPAVASVTDIEGPVDLAIILVKEPLPVLEECLAAGVGAAVVFSAGFAEVGTPEGRAAQDRLVELASGDMRVLGPNTNLNIFEPWPEGFPGRKLAIITQSGYQGRPITQGQVLGIGIQGWATVGNEADLEWADFVAYYAGLADTGCIATFVEGFKDGRTLQLAADAAARAGVPIVCVKVGRSEQGTAMAAAHTGHLTGADAVHDAVFEQYGVIRVDDIDELIEISGMFCHAPRPTGPGGVAIYALSGGTASHTADLCGSLGVDVPRLADRTIEALGEVIPWFLRTDNPVDTGGTLAGKPEGRRVLELLVDDPNTGIVFAPITGVFPGMSDRLAADLIEIHRQARKPVVVAWISPIRDDPAYRALCDAGVPLFHSFLGAIHGMKALADHTAFVAGYQSPFDVDVPPAGAAALAARSLLGAGPLDEVRSKSILRAYGIPTVAEQVATSADEAAKAAAELGLPVVLKVLSADIAHKSDLGLVAVGLTSEVEVRRAYARVMTDVARLAPAAVVSGVVVQSMVGDVVAEVILGLSHQVPFGPTLTAGLGGVLTELYRDVAFAVPPFTSRDARTMVGRTKLATLLAGFRGRPAGDVDALIDAIMALQRLAVELGEEVAEIDINPLLVRADGRGVVAVDALIVGREAA